MAKPQVIEEKIIAWDFINALCRTSSGKTYVIYWNLPLANHTKCNDLELNQMQWGPEKLKSIFILNKAHTKWPTLNLNNCVTTEDNLDLFFSAKRSFQGYLKCAWLGGVCLGAPRLCAHTLRTGQSAPRDVLQGQGKSQSLAGTGMLGLRHARPSSSRQPERARPRWWVARVRELRQRIWQKSSKTKQKDFGSLEPPGFNSFYKLS